MAEKESDTLMIRLSPTLKRMLQDYIKKDTHSTLSEFVRDAIRRKIEADAPHLMKKIFEETAE